MAVSKQMKLLAVLVLCQLCGLGTSQPCLYNYTIGGSSTVIVTQSAPVCLICSNTANNVWSTSGLTLPAPIAATPYILYVTTPTTTFIGDPGIGCYTGLFMNLATSNVGIAAPVVPQVVLNVNETDTLNLTCSSVITSSASVVSGQIWLDPRGINISASSNISLPSISRTDAGNYTCVTQLVPNVNNMTSVNASTTVVVYYLNITSPQPSVFMPQGLTVQLNCSFNGLPVPTITWTLPNGSVLTSSQGRYMLQSTSTSASLTVSSLVGGGDSGTYTCTASNLRGVASSTVQLTVQVPPDAPSSLAVTSTDNSSISLSWSNGFNGYSSLSTVVISYEVDRYPQDGTRSQTFPIGTSAILIGLYPYSNYTIHVMLTNAAGLVSNPSNTTATTASLRPTAPSITSVVANNSTQLTIAWTAPPINSSTTAPLTSWTISYTCFSSWSLSCPSGTITSIPPSSSFYFISGLVKGFSYTFVVGGVNSGGVGDLSPPATNQTTVDLPSSPSNFLLSPVPGSPTALFANWSVPIPKNGIITGYSVYCKTSASQSYSEQVIRSNVPTIRSVVNGTTLAVTLTGLNPYTQYSCYVTANTSAGEGSPSEILTTRTFEGAPSSPLNLSVSSGYTNLFPMWSPPVPKNGIITAYTVYCNTSASQAYPEQVIGPNVPTVRSVVNGTTTAVIFNIGLNPYTQYDCYVTANTSVGEGTPSQIVTAKTDQSTPSSPSNFSLSPVLGSPTALSANWSVPISRNGIITGYTVYCNTSASQAYPERMIGSNVPTTRSVVNGTTLAVRLTGLNPYTQYSCYVTANTSAGEGSPSKILTMRTGEGVPSGAPGTVAAITVAPTSVNVSWNQLPNTSRNGIIITYEVAYTWSLGNRQLATNSVNTSGAQNQLLLNMLQECVQYSISVRAYTSQGPGPYSAPVHDSSLNMYAQVPQPPEVLLSNLNLTSANLTWSCPLEKNYTIISYSVNVTVTDPSSIDAGCINRQNLSYYITVPGHQRYVLLKGMLLLPFTSYSFEVLAHTTQGEGVFSIPRSFTTLQPPPTSPLNLNVSVLSYSSLLVSWNPPACRNRIVSGYMVTYTPSSGFPSSSYNVSNVTTLLLQNLLNNTQYTILLCAFTAGGCGPNMTANGTTFPGPTTNPSIIYVRLSTLTNIGNHQNDAALYQLQNQLYSAVNNSVPGSKRSELSISCAAVQTCESGQYRVECKILIFLKVDMNTTVQALSMMNISVASPILLVNTESISANGFCNCELNVTSDHGTYNWPEAEPNHIDSQLCQYGVMIGQKITRYCNTNLTWTEDSSKCPTVVTNQFAQLNNQTVTTQNVANVTAQLQTVVSQATQVVDQSASNLAVVAAWITQISNILSQAPVQTNTIMNVVSVLSSIQTWPPMVLSTTGSIIVQNFEKIATSFVQQDNFTSFDATNNEIVFGAEKIPLETVTTQGKSFATENNVQTSDNSSANITPPPSSSAKLTASVFLPQRLFSPPKTDST